MDWLNNSKLKTNDLFFTPLSVAKECINMTPLEGVVLDAWRGDGAFYNNYGLEITEKCWAEITENKDFMDWVEPVDWICSNPPYSLLKTHLPKVLKLCKKGFGLLLGSINLTTARLKLIADAGFFVNRIHFINIDGFGLGTSVYIICSKIITNYITFNNTKYEMDGQPGIDRKKNKQIYQQKYRNRLK